jgi:hypothetical protein
LLIFWVIFLLMSFWRRPKCCCCLSVFLYVFLCFLCIYRCTTILRTECMKRKMTIRIMFEWLSFVDFLSDFLLMSFWRRPKCCCCLSVFSHVCSCFSCIYRCTTILRTECMKRKMMIRIMFEWLSFVDFLSDFFVNVILTVS